MAGGMPYPTVGASGGVFGLLLAFGMMFPRAGHAAVSAHSDARLAAGHALRRAELFMGITGTQQGVPISPIWRDGRRLPADPVLARPAADQAGAALIAGSGRSHAETPGPGAISGDRNSFHLTAPRARSANWAVRAGATLGVG